MPELKLLAKLSWRRSDVKCSIETIDIDASARNQQRASFLPSRGARRMQDRHHFENRGRGSASAFCGARDRLGRNVKARGRSRRIENRRCRANDQYAGVLRAAKGRKRMVWCRALCEIGLQLDEDLEMLLTRPIGSGLRAVEWKRR